MISLIFKDLCTQAKYLGLLAVFMLIMGLGMDLPPAIYVSIGVVMTAMRLTYLEEKNNTLLLFKTMPISPLTVVFSKYLVSLLIAAFFLLESLAYLAVFGELTVESVVGSIAGMTVMLIYSGVLYMLFFKFGYAKASTYIRLSFLLFFIPMAVPKVALRIQSLMEVVANNVPMVWLTGVVAELVLIGIYFLLAAFAVRFYRMRESF